MTIFKSLFKPFCIFLIFLWVIHKMTSFLGYMNKYWTQMSLCSVSNALIIHNLSLIIIIFLGLINFLLINTKEMMTNIEVLAYPKWWIEEFVQKDLREKLKRVSRKRRGGGTVVANEGALQDGVPSPICKVFG